MTSEPIKTESTRLEKLTDMMVNRLKLNYHKWGFGLWRLAIKKTNGSSSSPKWVFKPYEIENEFDCIELLFKHFVYEKQSKPKLQALYKTKEDRNEDLKILYEPRLDEEKYEECLKKRMSELLDVFFKKFRTALLEEGVIEWFITKEDQTIIDVSVLLPEAYIDEYKALLNHARATILENNAKRTLENVYARQHQYPPDESRKRLKGPFSDE